MIAVEVATHVVMRLGLVQLHMSSIVQELVDLHSTRNVFLSADSQRLVYNGSSPEGRPDIQPRCSGVSGFIVVCANAN